MAFQWQNRCFCWTIWRSGCPVKTSEFWGPKSWQTPFRIWKGRREESRLGHRFSLGENPLYNLLLPDDRLGQMTLR